MTLKTMLLIVRPSKKRSARMWPKVTPLRRSVPNGPNKSVLARRRTSRSTLLKLNVRRSPGNFVDPLDVFSNLDPKNVSTKRRLSSKKFLRKLATSNLKSLVNLSPNWFPCWNLLKNVLTFPRKFAQETDKTPERSKSLWLRSGVMSPLKNPAWANKEFAKA